MNFLRLSYTKQLLATLSVFAAPSVHALDLLAYYDFDGQSKDQSGNAPDATLSGNAALSADGAGYTGRAGDQSLDLGATANDGTTGALVAAGAHFATATTNNAMAVSFWQFLTSIDDSAAFWLMSSTSNRGFIAHAPWSDNTIYFDHNNGQRLSIGDTVATNTWNHFVFQKDALGNKEIWKNGSLLAKMANNQDIPAFKGSFAIGAELYGEGNVVNNNIAGRIDEFAVFNGVLTSSQITLLSGGARTTDLFDRTDNDNDGLLDSFEQQIIDADLDDAIATIGDVLPGDDFDSDGLTNEEERDARTDPIDSDSDDDTLKDGDEVAGAGSRPATNPNLADTDGDSLSDLVETNTGIFISASDTGTNPTVNANENHRFSTKGPANNDFAKAQALQGNLPVQVKGSLSDKLDRFRATKQDGEPDHAGSEGAGSVWYSWISKKDQRVEVTASAPSMNLILAVYTGTSVNNLLLAHRYEEFASPAFSKKRTEPFTEDARVEFVANQGVTYYIVVDTENFVHEDFELEINPSRNNFNPALELMKPGGKWEYLIAANKDGDPVNPVSLDEDFYYTWMFPNRYDGPKFKTGWAPLGYGKIESFKIRSNLFGKRDVQPPEEKRHTAYLRTTFTPLLDTTAIGIEGVIDDGAIIYLNGREVSRINVSERINSHSWRASASDDNVNGVDVEKLIQYITIKDLNLPADAPVRLSLSLHNVLPTSSDLGLDLRVFMLNTRTQN